MDNKELAEQCLRVATELGGQLALQREDRKKLLARVESLQMELYSIKCELAGSKAERDAWRDSYNELLDRMERELDV